ncbi:hypothetical protein ACFV4N_05760 [Actinosynnema sp. NPDC059797]
MKSVTSFIARSTVVAAAVLATTFGAQTAQAAGTAGAAGARAVEPAAGEVGAQVICGLHKEFWGWYWGNCTSGAKIIRWYAYPGAQWEYDCTAPHSDTWLSDTTGNPVVEVLSGPCIP